MGKLIKINKLLLSLPKLAKKTAQEVASPPTDPSVKPQGDEESEALSELLSSLGGSDSDADVLNNRGILFLNSVITPYSVQPLIHRMWILHFNKDFNEPIQLILHSDGGDLGAGWSVIDTMRAIRLPVVTIAVGDIFSMAANIFVAGDYRMMTPNSKAMIHHFYKSSRGNYPALLADRKLEQMEYDKFIAHFIQCSKYRSEKAILQHVLLEQDNFLSPAEMVKHGLADEVFKPMKKRIKRC